MNTLTSKDRNLQSGFTLIEVLIAILVMSIGLLGLAALQTRVLTDSTGAKFRQAATTQAYAFADVMRSNRPALLAGGFDGLSASHPVTANCMVTTGCTTTQMAQTSFDNWLKQLANSLPSGVGTVCRDSSPDDGSPTAMACDGSPTGLYVIKVWWVDDKLNPTTYQRFVTVVMP